MDGTRIDADEHLSRVRNARLHVPEREHDVRFTRFIEYDGSHATPRRMSAGARASVFDDDALDTSTSLPATPPFPSSSCACLASERGRRCATSGLISCRRRSSTSVIRSCRNQAGLARLSVWML